MPHNDVVCPQYCPTVWDNTVYILHNYEACTYAKFSHKSRGGWKGYYGVHDNYLVPNNVYHLVEKSRNHLPNLSNHGDKKHYNF